MAGNGALITRQTEVAGEHISTAYGSHYECMSHTWPKVGQRSLTAHVAVLVGSPWRLASSQLDEPVARRSPSVEQEQRNAVAMKYNEAPKPYLACLYLARVHQKPTLG